MRRPLHRSSPFAPPSRRLLAIFLLVWATACQTFNVRSDWDESVAFDGLSSYAWLEPPEAEGADPFADNSLLRKRIRTAIEANLTARGFRAAPDPADADFLVTWGVVLDEKLRVNGGGSFYGGYGYGRWPYGFGGGYGATDVRDYQEATLFIDFLDAESEEILWRGWGSGFLPTRDRDRTRARFDAGIKAVLDAYPPAAKPR